MIFKARLNLKFYIISIVLLCLVAFVWYGIYFLNTNEILMEDNTPMSAGTKAVFTVFMSMIALSWTLLVLIRQMVIGLAFCIDKSGICTTATASLVLAFIFIVPIRRIPYDAIIQVSEKDGGLMVELNKSKIEASPVFKFFARNEFHFFLGFTKEKQNEIKQALNQYMRKNDF